MSGALAAWHVNRVGGTTRAAAVAAISNIRGISISVDFYTTAFLQLNMDNEV